MVWVGFPQLFHSALACSRFSSFDPGRSPRGNPTLWTSGRSPRSCSRPLSLLESRSRALPMWQSHTADPRSITSTCAYPRVARSALSLTIPSPGDDRRRGIIAPCRSLPTAERFSQLVTPSCGLQRPTGLSQWRPRLWSLPAVFLVPRTTVPRSGLACSHLRSFPLPLPFLAARPGCPCLTLLREAAS